MQHAWDTVLNTLNGFGGSCTFQILDTLPSGLVTSSPLNGFPTTIIHGGYITVSPPGPAACGFNVTESACVLFNNSGPITLSALYFETASTTNEASCVKASGSSNITVNACNFGPCQSHMLHAIQNATVTGNNCTLVGSTLPEGYTAESLACAESNGTVSMTGTFDLVGPDPNNVVWNTGCAYAPGSTGASGGTGGVVNAFSDQLNFTNSNGSSFLGPRYHVDSGGTINTHGGGQNFLPGDQAGINTGGTYI